MREERSLCHEDVWAIEQGAVESLGALMTQAQSIFDRGAVPNCPENLTSPKLHAVIQNNTLKYVLCIGSLLLVCIGNIK